MVRKVLTRYEICVIQCDTETKFCLQWKSLESRRPKKTEYWNQSIKLCSLAFW